MRLAYLRLLAIHVFTIWWSRRSALAAKQAVINERRARFADEIDAMVYAGSSSDAIAARVEEQERQIEQLLLSRDGTGEWPESDTPDTWLPRTGAERWGSVLEPLAIAFLFGALFNLLQASPWAGLFLAAAAVSFLAGLWLQAGPLPSPAYARARLSALAERRP